MAYSFGILISLAAGFLFIRFLALQGLNFILCILLALTLGLGIDGTVGFYTHILLNQFNRFIPIGVVILGICLLFFRQRSKLKIKISRDHLWGLLALGLLAVPLTVSAHYFPLGGWDAWSCWNLKAKFIFLGQEHWNDMLAPDLWRSNTQYPLLWPLINVWFWDLGGHFDQAVPMLNGIVIALLTAGVLLFGLLELTGMLIPSILAAVMVAALPFDVILYTSQYSDSLLGLFLLSAFMCWLLAEKYDLPELKILSMIFLGLMSFTKSEGLVAAIISGGLMICKDIASSSRQGGSPWNGCRKLIFWFIIAALPTIIFMLFIAPKNEAFSNGLLSTDKPVHLTRLGVILIYPWLEFISGKWNGFWFLVFGGILLARKKLWQSTLGIMGLSLILYLGVVMAYYAVNTYFDIVWWLEQTFSRILFAMVPTITLWIGLALLT